MEGKGVFFVLEGSDGSGKSTQLKVLAERLKAVGHDVAAYDFPRYFEQSSYFVRRYLNGDYGPASEVSPYTASLFYAMDRFEAAPQIRQSISEGKIVLANRYSASNMAHQGSKFTNSGEQRGFFMWVDSLEYELLGIPRPNLNIFLRVPAEISAKLLSRRELHSSSGKVHDEHEVDKDHLRKSVAAYDNLCRLFPRDYKIVECAKKNGIRPIPEINNDIWKILRPYLPKPTKKASPKVVKLNDDFRSKKQRRWQSKTDSGESLNLKDVSLIAVDSLHTAALPNIQYELSWPPKKSKTRLDYFVPAQLGPELTKKYHSTMAELTELYRRMQKTAKASKYLEAAIPMAVLVNAKISGSEAIERAIDKASISSLDELKQIANQKTRRSTKEPEELRQIIKQLSNTRLPLAKADDEPVKLNDCWPRTEFDLLCEHLVEQSDLEREDIAAEMDKWPYERKAKALKAAYAKSGPSILEKARYRFSIITDRRTAGRLAARLQPTEFEIHPPNPLYGYDVPMDLEQAGTEGLFIECFDLSTDLFSDLQAAGHNFSAVYASLAGHKLHCQITINGRFLMEQLAIENVETKRIMTLITEKIADVHPLAVNGLKSRLNAASGKTITTS